MWFCKRQMHRLPQFPPGVIPAFKAMCEALSLEDFADLSVVIEATLKEAQEDPRCDVKLQTQIAAACAVLMRAYPEAAEKQKPLIVGALRYCALDQDAMSDEKFAAGYYDDVKVLNHVLEQVGIESAYIRFHH